MYEMGSGRRFKIPTTVLYGPLTSSTTNTKLTTSTAIDVMPLMNRNTINMGRVEEKASNIPGSKAFVGYE